MEELQLRVRELETENATLKYREVLASREIQYLRSELASLNTSASGGQPAEHILDFPPLESPPLSPLELWTSSLLCRPKSETERSRSLVFAQLELLCLPQEDTTFDLLYSYNIHQHALLQTSPPLRHLCPQHLLSLSPLSLSFFLGGKKISASFLKPARFFSSGRQSDRSGRLQSGARARQE